MLNSHSVFTQRGLAPSWSSREQNIYPSHWLHKVFSDVQHQLSIPAQGGITKARGNREHNDFMWCFLGISLYMLAYSKRTHTSVEQQRTQNTYPSEWLPAVFSDAPQPLSVSAQRGLPPACCMPCWGLCGDQKFWWWPLPGWQSPKIKKKNSKKIQIKMIHHRLH